MRQEAVDNADAYFQVREYGGELWLTYDGCLVCPCAMLRKEPVEALKEMRELYIRRCEG